VDQNEEGRYRVQPAAHRYLGDLPKMGETIWCIATSRDEWVAQVSVSAAALNCGLRNRWIGWDLRTQYGRLKLISNNKPVPYPAGLAPPECRLARTGIAGAAHWGGLASALVRFCCLLESFVDPRRLHGDVDRAANWPEIGQSQGYGRTVAATTKRLTRPSVS
jgi:hypothetical protein